MTLRAVRSFEEEWRTSGWRGVRPGGRSYGRACLWLRLACGHCEQRMAALDRAGNFVAPRRVRCGEC